MSKIVLATCQFSIKKEMEPNLRSVRQQMQQAAADGAQLVHFSEACLSGYLGSELGSVADMDWDALTDAMHDIMGLAGDLGLWVVVGSNHRLSGKHKPHNSLYVINDRGQLVTRYDKMFCTGQDANSGDLRHYSPGDSFVTFTVNGVTCGLLICHDFRYPELFREYKKRGAELMLVSFHNAGMTADRSAKYKEYVSATM